MKKNLLAAIGTLVMAAGNAAAYNVCYLENVYSMPGYYGLGNVPDAQSCADLVGIYSAAGYYWGPDSVFLDSVDMTGRVCASATGTNQVGEFSTGAQCRAIEGTPTFNGGFADPLITTDLDLDVWGPGGDRSSYTPGGGTPNTFGVNLLDAAGNLADVGSLILGLVVFYMGYLYTEKAVAPDAKGKTAKA